MEKYKAGIRRQISNTAARQIPSDPDQCYCLASGSPLPKSLNASGPIIATALLLEKASSDCPPLQERETEHLQKLQDPPGQLSHSNCPRFPLLKQTKCPVPQIHLLRKFLPSVRVSGKGVTNMEFLSSLGNTDIRLYILSPFT